MKLLGEGVGVKFNIPCGYHSSVLTFKAAKNFLTLDISPLTKKVTIPLNPFTCFFMSSYCGCVGSPGYNTLETWGDPSRNCATARALVWCSRILIWSVLRPRLARKQSKGLGMQPEAKRTSRDNAEFKHTE